MLPWVLDPDHPDRPATPGDNVRDNIEQVYVASPLPGQAYTITVTHKKTLTYGSQPFSVVVSGLRQTACGLSVSVAPRRDTTICAGSSLTLTATGSTGTAYEWLQNGLKTGVTTSTNRITQAGYYAVRATDRQGCTGTSTAVHVTVFSPTATVMPVGEVWQCNPAAPLSLSAAVTNGMQYQWLREGQPIAGSNLTPTLPVTQPGSYQIKVSQQGCTGVSPVVSVRASTVTTIRLLPDVGNLVIPRGASVRLSSPADPTYRYQWYCADQPVANALTNRLSVSQPGIYKVLVTQQGCTGFSPTLTVRWADGTTATLSLPDSLLSYEPADSSLTIFPNPATTQVTIQYAFPLAKLVGVSIYNAQGAICRENLPMRSVKSYFQLDLSVADLPPGYYLLRLTDGPRNRISRFIKH